MYEGAAAPQVQAQFLEMYGNKGSYVKLGNGGGNIGLFIQQPVRLGGEAVGQSGGPGTDGSIPLSRGQKMEQTVCWV